MVTGTFFDFKECVLTGLLGGLGFFHTASEDRIA
jgi:hypothetical protein